MLYFSKLNASDLNEWIDECFIQIYYQPIVVIDEGTVIDSREVGTGLLFPSTI